MLITTSPQTTSNRSNQAPHILPISHPTPRLPPLAPHSLPTRPQSILTLPRSVKPRSLKLARLPRIGIISVQERLLRVNLLAAARVARASAPRPRWLLARRGTGLSWQCDVAPPARQSGRWDVVAVWAGAGLEQDGGRAQGDVGVNAEVYHQRDEAVGSEDGVVGAEPAVVGHCDPATIDEREYKSACARMHAKKNNSRCMYIPQHHHDHEERRGGEISARQGVLDVGVVFFASERCHADQTRHAHGDETDGGKRVAGHNARGDEEGESWDH